LLNAPHVAVAHPKISPVSRTQYGAAVTSFSLDRPYTLEDNFRRAATQFGMILSILVARLVISRTLLAISLYVECGHFRLSRAGPFTRPGHNQAMRSAF
jgi:hypothetical protein